MSLAEMALRFILADRDVSTIIVGMRKLQHVRENMKLSDEGPLDPALLQSCANIAGTVNRRGGPTRQHAGRTWRDYLFVDFLRCERG